LLVVILEGTDTWYDGKYGTLEDIIKNQKIKQEEAYGNMQIL